MEQLAKFRQYFSDRAFWAKLKGFAGAASGQTVYSALLLYYAYQRKETPGWAKKAVLGVLGYLIMPLDFVPDLTPLLGYTDDLGFLTLGVSMIAAYINDDVRRQARERMAAWGMGE